MIDILLLTGRIALIAFLYLFLVFAIRSGIGIVRGQSRSNRQGLYTITLTHGPSTLSGTTIPITATLIIGRAPGSDLHLSDDFVSGKHARITPVNDTAVLEDLDSTNGTLLNGRRVSAPQNLVPGDKIDIGPYSLTVDMR